MTSDTGDYIKLNLKPLLKKCKHKCTSWCKLPLSATGRASLIKMVRAPQLLYVLHNALVWIPHYWFDCIDSHYRALIWKNGVACNKLTTLQYPKDLIGMAIPHSFTYFLAAQLKHLSGWDLLGTLDPSRCLLVKSLADYSAMAQLKMGLTDVSLDCPMVELEWVTCFFFFDNAPPFGEIGHTLN